MLINGIMMQTYNLALICDSDDDRMALENSSQKVRVAAKDDDYVLGINSIPHVTIAQFKADESDLPKIWKRATDLNANRLLLPITVFYGQPKKSFGKNYTGYAVHKTEDLERLSAAIHTILADFEITSGPHEIFFPHFTLGFIDLSQLQTLSDIADDLEQISVRSITGSLAIGLTGSDGQFIRCLYQ